MNRIIYCAALMALAGSAMAQGSDEGACAGLAGSLAPATAQAGFVADMVARSDAQGAVRAPFTLEGQTALRLEAAPVGEGDPELTLHDSQGAILASDDDGGGGLSSRVELDLEAGAYCMAVRNLSGQLAQFALRIAEQSQPTLTAGAQAAPGAPAPCTPETSAVRIEEGDPARDGLRHFASAQAAPFLRFRLDAPLALTIRAESQPADPSIALYDARGAQLAANDDFDGRNAQIDLSEALAAGDYCIGVSALSDPTAPISVSVTTFDEAAYFQRLYRSGAASPPPDGDFPVVDLGVLGGAISRDLRIANVVSWLSFEITEESMVEVRGVALSPSGDFKLQLHDELGVRIEENDDYVDLNPRIAPLLQPGRYMLGLGVVDSAEPGVTGQGGPARLSIRRFVPVQ